MNQKNTNTNANDNAGLQDKLHQIVDRLSSNLKIELDSALKNLLTMSDEYDETNRIIMTLPIVRKFVQNTCTTTNYINIVSNALESLKEYVGDDDEFVPDVLLKEEKEEKKEKEKGVEIVITEISDESGDDGECLESDSEEEDDTEEDDDSTDLINLLDTTDEESLEEEGTVQEDVEDIDVEEEEGSVEEEEADEEDVEDVVVEEEEDVAEEEDVEEEDAEDVVVSEEVEEVSVAVEEEEEEGVYEVTINGEVYYTTDQENGVIYNSDDNGDPGDEVGNFVNGEAVFSV